MIISPFATSMTRRMYEGKPAGEPDMSKKYPPKKRNRTSETPNTRSGKTYPGGRTLRRALTKLAARKSQSYKSGQRTPGSMMK